MGIGPDHRLANLRRGYSRRMAGKRQPMLHGESGSGKSSAMACCPHPVSHQIGRCGAIARVPRSSKRMVVAGTARSTLLEVFRGITGSCKYNPRTSWKPFATISIDTPFRERHCIFNAVVADDLVGSSFVSNRRCAENGCLRRKQSRGHWRCVGLHPRTVKSMVLSVLAMAAAEFKAKTDA